MATCSAGLAHLAEYLRASERPASQPRPKTKSPTSPNFKQDPGPTPKGRARGMCPGQMATRTVPEREPVPHASQSPVFQEVFPDNDPWQESELPSTGAEVFEIGEEVEEKQMETQVEEPLGQLVPSLQALLQHPHANTETAQLVQALMAHVEREPPATGAMSEDIQARAGEEVERRVG